MYVQEQLLNIDQDGIGPGSSPWDFFSYPGYQGSSISTDTAGIFLDVPFGGCGAYVLSKRILEQQFRVGMRLANDPATGKLILIGTTYMLRDHMNV